MPPAGSWQPPAPAPPAHRLRRASHSTTSLANRSPRPTRWEVAPRTSSPSTATARWCGPTLTPTGAFVSKPTTETARCKASLVPPLTQSAMNTAWSRAATPPATPTTPGNATRWKSSSTLTAPTPPSGPGHTWMPPAGHTRHSTPTAPPAIFPTTRIPRPGTTTRACFGNRGTRMASSPCTPSTPRPSGNIASPFPVTSRAASLTTARSSPH